MRQVLKFSAFAATGLLGLVNTACAQITWETSVQMYQGATDQSFVDTTGDVLVALNATADTSGNQNVTVNGVAFTGSQADTPLVGVGSHSITINGGSNHANAFGDGEFTSDGDIFHLIRGAVFEVNSVTLDGLVVGNDYRILVFTNDARNTRSFLFRAGFGDGSGSTAPVGISNLNNGPNTSTVGPVTCNNVQDPPVFPETEAGDSITGTFTATATSLTFNVFGTNSDPANFQQAVGLSQINAI